MTNENEMKALAERMTRAYEQNDTDAVPACYTVDARIWHNIGGVVQTVQDQLGATRWLNEKLKNIKYEIVSRIFFDGGYFQHTSCTALLPTAAELSACRSA